MPPCPAIENTQKLKILRAQVKEQLIGYSQRAPGEAVAYSSAKGTVVGFPLANDKHFAVINVLFTDGGETVKHVHDHSKETVVVTRGRLILEIDGCQGVIVEEGESYTIDAGIPHVARAEAEWGDCWILAIAVPGDVKEYGETTDG